MPVELQQHPEPATVPVDQVERRARDESRGARIGRPGAVLPLDQRQRAADEVGQRVAPRAGTTWPATCRPYTDTPSLARAGSPSRSSPFGKVRPSARSRHPRWPRAHERRVALAVVEARPVVDQQEPPVFLRAVRSELDRVRMVQPKALDRSDVDAGDTWRGHRRAMLQRRVDVTRGGT